VPIKRCKGDQFVAVGTKARLPRTERLGAGLELPNSSADSGLGNVARCKAPTDADSRMKNVVVWAISRPTVVPGEFATDASH
jgi:hypothetical protein